MFDECTFAADPAGLAGRRVRVDDDFVRQSVIALPLPIDGLRARNRPLPGLPLISPSRQTMSPREIVILGQPFTFIPSNAV